MEAAIVAETMVIADQASFAIHAVRRSLVLSPTHCEKSAARLTVSSRAGREAVTAAGYLASEPVPAVRR